MAWLDDSSLCSAEKENKKQMFAAGEHPNRRKLNLAFLRQLLFFDLIKNYLFLPVFYLKLRNLEARTYASALDVASVVLSLLRQAADLTKQYPYLVSKSSTADRLKKIKEFVIYESHQLIEKDEEIILDRGQFRSSHENIMTLINQMPSSTDQLIQEVPGKLHWCNGQAQVLKSSYDYLVNQQFTPRYLQASLQKFMSTLKDSSNIESLIDDAAKMPDTEGESPEMQMQDSQLTYRRVTG